MVIVWEEIWKHILLLFLACGQDPRQRKNGLQTPLLAVACEHVRVLHEVTNTRPPHPVPGKVHSGSEVAQSSP